MSHPPHGTPREEPRAVPPLESGGAGAGGAAAGGGPSGAGASGAGASGAGAGGVAAGDAAREALLERAARLALIFDGTSDLVFLMAVERERDDAVPTYRCESVNAAYRAVTGLSDADLLGRTMEEILPAAAAAFVRARYDAALREGREQRYDEDVVLPSGAQVVVETTLTPVRDAAGRVTHLLGVARDVGALRRAEAALRASEARYRALVDSAPDGVLVHVGGKIRYANAAPARLVGATDPDALVGRTLADLVVPDERPALAARLARARTTDAGGISEQTLQRLDTGAPVPVELSTVPTAFPEAGRTEAAFQVTVRDLTARREAESAREALAARLQHAQKMEAVGQLAGGLAHDFNNLLTVIGGNREMAAMALDDPPAARECLAEIADAVDRGRRLVRSLLTFSRRGAMREEALDVVEVVRSFVPLLRTAVGERVTLRFALPAARVPLRADRAQVEQLLMNLVVNARDAVLTARHGHPGHGGTVTLTLCTRRVGEGADGPDDLPPGAEYVELVVRDDGHGMDAETAEHAFEPFFTTKAPGVGSGLGLATVFGIVRRMRGTVAIASRPGAGTTVTLCLPCGDASGVRPTPPGASLLLPGAPALRAAPGDAAPAAPLAGKVVLLVEDEPGVRQVSRRLLERVGLRVVDAANGLEGLARWHEWGDGIGLLLTDVRMPEMDGLELAHRVRADRPDLPIVFMSGYTDREPLAEWQSRMAFVPKPFAAEELLHAVTAVLATR